MAGDMRQLDEDRADLERQAVLDALQHERHLLGLKAEEVRNFYSLTGGPRKSYVEQIAEAEAARIKLSGAARAENIRVAAESSANAIRLIGDALAAAPNPQHVLEYLRIQAIERVAQSFANGRSTKILLPHALEGLFSTLSMTQVVAGAAQTNAQVAADGNEVASG